LVPGGSFVRRPAGDRTVEAVLELAPFREDVTVEGVATVPTIGRVNVPLRDQPLTVNTLTSEFLTTYAVNDLVTALKYIPNATAYSQYGVYQYFTFRGFSDNVQLVDGIRNEGNRVNTQLANVERLEVLKGPASVLYGGDAIGATVNIVLKKPSPDPVYDFSGTVGRWDTYRSSFGAAGRVGRMDDVFYRFDIAGDAADNFRHDQSKRLNVTPSVTWRTSAAGRLDFRYSYDRNRASGDSGIPLVPLTGGFVPDPTRTAIGDPLLRAVQGDGSDFIPDVPNDTRFNTPQDFALGTDQNFFASYAHVFGRGLAFRNTFGYRYFDDEYWTTELLDVTPPSRVNRGFLYFMHHRRPWTNQAELSGQAKLGLTNDFLIGYDYQDYRNYTHRRAAANYNTTPIDLYDPVETHVNVDLYSLPITRNDHFTNETNLTGNTPRRVPDHTVNVVTSYAWANGFSVNGGVQAVSHQFINDTNTVGFSGYTLVNMGASYTKGRVQYLLNLTNLTDSEYWASSLGNRQLYPGQPFNVMATVRIRTN
jgi:iron complex outermembrane receptor protein